MQWFHHDTNAAHDAKMRKLILKHGPTGYAIYFHCLELIAGDLNANNITFELEHDAEIIADNLKIQGTSKLSSVDLVQDVMMYIISLDLFTESEGRIFCFKLLKRLDSSMTSNPKMRKMITQAKKGHDGVMIPSCEGHDTDMIPSCKNRREENRREEKEKSTKKEKPIKNQIPPKIDDVKSYCSERSNGIDPEAFIAHYESKGWLVGKQKMKDWQAAIRTWERNNGGNQGNPRQGNREKSRTFGEGRGYEKPFTGF